MASMATSTTRRSSVFQGPPAVDPAHSQPPCMHAKLLATPRHLLRKERSRTDQPFLQHEKLRAGPPCRLINNFHRILITQALVFSLWRCRLSIAGPLTKVDYQGGGWVWVCMQADISLHHLSYLSSSFSFLAARTFLTIKATDQALGQRQPPPLPYAPELLDHDQCHQAPPEEDCRDR